MVLNVPAQTMPGNAAREIERCKRLQKKKCWRSKAATGTDVAKGSLCSAGIALAVLLHELNGITNSPTSILHSRREHPFSSRSRNSGFPLCSQSENHPGLAVCGGFAKFY